MTSAKPQLGDVVEVLSGFAFKSDRFGETGEIPLVRIRDVVRGQSNTYYSGEYDRKFLIGDGDLLIGMDGEFNRARWSGGPALLNQRVCKLEPRADVVDASYLFHFLPAALKEIERKTPFVTVKHLSTKQIRQIEIPLPPIEEQRRIAAVLDAADALRAKRRQAIDKLDTLTQAIFIDMFGDPATNLHGWPSVAIDSLAAGKDGIKCGPFGTQLAQSEYREHGVPLWGIRQVNRGFAVRTQEFLTAAKAEELAGYSLKPGDLVMTRKGTVGNCAVYPDSFEHGIMHSDLLRLRLGNDVDPIFMVQQLTHSRDVVEQIRVMSGGAIMPGVNVSKLKKLSVLSPPIDAQRHFARRARGVEQARRKEVSGLGLLENLFASLQQRAFRGEL